MLIGFNFQAYLLTNHLRCAILPAHFHGVFGLLPSVLDGISCSHFFCKHLNFPHQILLALGISKVSNSSQFSNLFALTIYLRFAIPWSCLDFEEISFKRFFCKYLNLPIQNLLTLENLTFANKWCLIQVFSPLTKLTFRTKLLASFWAKFWRLVP